MIPMYKGGRFTSTGKRGKGVEAYSRINWDDNGPEPKDLTSLIINILMYRLSNQVSLDTQLVMSANGSFIYIVVKADEGDICKVADQNSFNAQFNIGVTDLASLDACDKNYIPYRKVECPYEDKKIELDKLVSDLHEFF
jgi:hypothetical protein